MRTGINFSLYLDPEQVSWIREKTKRGGSVSSFIRDLINREKEKTSAKE